MNTPLSIIHIYLTLSSSPCQSVPSAHVSSESLSFRHLNSPGKLVLWSPCRSKVIFIFLLLAIGVCTLFHTRCCDRKFQLQQTLFNEWNNRSSCILNYILKQSTLSSDDTRINRILKGIEQIDQAVLSLQINSTTDTTFPTSTISTTPI